MKTPTTLLLAALLAPATAASPRQLDPSPIDPVRAVGSGFSFGSHSFRHAPHDGWTASRPDGHAPIGVMGDHMHEAGEWMVAVRVMRMHMDGTRNNDDDLSSADVLGSFAVTPTQMDMDMVMIGAMYAPTDDVTLTLMLPYVRNEMDHTNGTIGFTTESDGLGDVQLGGLYSVHDEGGHRVHVNFAISVPTGSTDERDDTPAMMNAKLPYPMQLGTGTLDFLPGLTYLGQDGDWSWGAQAIPRIHVGTNTEGYRRGDRIQGTGWLARRIGELSVSFRLNLATWGNIHGTDPDINPAMVPTADADRQGGSRFDALFGLNYDFQENALAGNRLALEVGVPFYQYLDGPQLETDWTLTLGWQYAF